LSSTTAIAVWPAPAPDPVAGDLDLAVARSTDGGATWSVSAFLNSNAARDPASADDFADLNGNGVVDGADLGLLLSNWS